MSRMGMFSDLSRAALVLLVLAPVQAQAQGTRADYMRADSFAARADR
jgi:hypothetical protein